jgi:hypothetical protein
MMISGLHARVRRALLTLWRGRGLRRLAPAEPGIAGAFWSSGESVRVRALTAEERDDRAEARVAPRWLDRGGARRRRVVPGDG